MRVCGDELRGWDAKTAVMLEVLLDIRELLMNKVSPEGDTVSSSKDEVI